MKNLFVCMCILISVLLASTAFAQWKWNLTPELVQVQQDNVVLRVKTPASYTLYYNFPKSEKEILATALSALASGAKIAVDFTGSTITGIAVEAPK